MKWLLIPVLLVTVQVSPASGERKTFTGTKSGTTKERSVIVDESRGSIYDEKGERLGNIKRDASDNIEVFDKQGRRIGEIRERRR